MLLSGTRKELAGKIQKFKFFFYSSLNITFSCLIMTKTQFFLFFCLFSSDKSSVVEITIDHDHDDDSSQRPIMQNKVIVFHLPNELFDRS